MSEGLDVLVRCSTKSSRGPCPWVRTRQHLWPGSMMWGESASCAEGAGVRRQRGWLH